MPKVGDAAGFARYVLARAPRYNLDPNAVVVVSIQEGISGAVGDHGTSFGPFQLHAGGAYPSNGSHGAPDPSNAKAANAWAWSPAGIDYALERMSKSGAGGLKGRPAVHAIVYNFERPSNPAAEYNAAVQALPSNDGGPASNGTSILGIVGRVGSQIPVVGPVIGLGTDAVGAASSVVGGAEGVANFLGDLVDPHFWVRALQIIGGGLILFVGVYLLASKTGLAQKAQGVAVAAAVPEAKVAKVAAGAAALGPAK